MTLKAIPRTKDPVLPDYQGAAVCNIVPALLEHEAIGAGWLPEEVHDAKQVVFIIVDGLGYNQLAQRSHIAPTLAAGTARAITTVAPSTTACATTSIITGVPPGEHGIIGYRIRVAGETLNTIRWRTENGNALGSIVPELFQPVEPFGGRDVAVVTRSVFSGSGLSRAHLRGCETFGYRSIATMAQRIIQAVQTGSHLTYAYYDTLDILGHETGHGELYDAELAHIDLVVAALRERLDDSVALVISADHGQVLTGDNLIDIDESLLSLCVGYSGEPRFLWLHGRKGVSTSELVEVAKDKHGEHVWVMTQDEVLERNILGYRVTAEARSRMGSVAVIVHSDAALIDPKVTQKRLLGRHGSLTSDEMYVPLIVL